jgi:hypothetical protein
MRAGDLVVTLVLAEAIVGESKVADGSRPSASQRTGWLAGFE